MKKAAGHDIGAIFFWVLFFRSHKETYLAGEGETNVKSI